ncbi:hypothetical protein DNTS_030468 [Danionella cerebrum]|uniref:Protein kintoun n=1 Tax=Danionella cerebrum TaxID=2873325 RepID=A0A553MLZ7_9TELE|nr:hypothetical protein DNTS_030468 [Danionella translucida]
MSGSSGMASLNLTPEEESRLSAALQDKRFLSLLGEYAAELADPENRSRYEEEIRLMEAERGQKVRFLCSTPHHVLKTRAAGRKLFINICSDCQVEQPCSTVGTNRTGTPGTCWRLPYCLTPARADVDRTGAEVTVCDAVFHPDAVQEAERNPRIMRLLHSTALEGVGRALNVPLDQHVRRVKGIQYKGVPQPTIIRRPAEEPAPIQCQKLESNWNTTIPEPLQKTGPEPCQPQTRPELDPASESRSGPKPQDSEFLQGPREPQYAIRYRYQSDLELSGRRTQPEAILVRVELPELESTRHTEIHMEGDVLVLEDQNRIRLHLKLRLPVLEERATARFNKTNRVLEICLPVQNHTEMPLGLTGKVEIARTEECAKNKEPEEPKHEDKIDSSMRPRRGDSEVASREDDMNVNKQRSEELTSAVANAYNPVQEETNSAYLEPFENDLVDPGPEVLKTVVPDSEDADLMETNYVNLELEQPSAADREADNSKQDLPELIDKEPTNLRPVKQSANVRQLQTPKSDNSKPEHPEMNDREPTRLEVAEGVQEPNDQNATLSVIGDPKLTEPTSFLEPLKPENQKPALSEPTEQNSTCHEPAEPNQANSKAKQASYFEPVELEPADPYQKELNPAVVDLKLTSAYREHQERTPLTSSDPEQVEVIETHPVEKDAAPYPSVHSKEERDEDDLLGGSSATGPDPPVSISIRNGPGLGVQTVSFQNSLWFDLD